MKNKICPFLTTPCIEGECMAWVNDHCVILSKGKDVSDLETVEIPDTLINITIGDLTTKIANYLIQEDPDGDLYINLDDFLISEFNIEGAYLLPADLQSKVQKTYREAKKIAEDRRIPELLKKKKPNEIVKMISDWIEEEEKDFDDHTLLEQFWGHHDFNTQKSYSLPRKINTKYNRIRQLFWELLSDLKNKRREKEKAEEKKQALGETDEIISWLSEKEMEKLTKANLKVYLAEHGLKFSPTNRQAIYLAVNEKMQERK